VPKADVGPLKVPPELGVEQVLFLSDILPTGFMAVVNAEIEDGSIVAIFGAGPVGLMAVACARLKGAKTIYLIDHHQYRLDFAARTYGVIPVNFDMVDDPAAMIVRQTDGRGVDAAIDGVSRPRRPSLS
jgi:threonine dehydrogenase-like Zn-dependent dehydrogenase